MNVSDKHFISTVGSVPRSSKKSYRVWVLLLTRTAKRSEARYHNNIRVEASPVVEENLTESVVVGPEEESPKPTLISGGDIFNITFGL